jgi:hypothetical protein
MKEEKKVNEIIEKFVDDWRSTNREVIEDVRFINLIDYHFDYIIENEALDTFLLDEEVNFFLKNEDYFYNLFHSDEFVKKYENEYSEFVEAFEKSEYDAKLQKIEEEIDMAINNTKI